MNRLVLAVVAAALLSLAPLQHAVAQGQQFNVGDRVHIGLNNDNGTIVEVQTRLANGGFMVKIKRDSNGLTIAYDTMTSNVTSLAGGGGAPIQGGPQQPPVAPPLIPQMQPAPQQAQGGASILPGSYECWTGTGGPLHAAMSENFTILDGSNYRDTAGAPGTYQYNAGSSTIAFRGGALDGQSGVFSMPSNPPTKNRPPSVRINASGDACDLVM